MGRRSADGDLPDAPRGGAQGAFANPVSPDDGPPTTDHASLEEPPPPGGSWATLYGVVLGSLAVLILLFYAFTKVFE